MPAAIGVECFPRFLVYRRSYRLQRHPCGMPADVGWRWIGRAVASRLLMRIGGGTVLWVPPATTSGHSAMNVRGWCSQCRLQMRGVLRGTAFDLPPPHLLAVMGLDVKESTRDASNVSALPPPCNSQVWKFCKIFCWRVLHPPSRKLTSSDDKTAAAVGGGVGTAAGVGLAAGVGFAPAAAPVDVSFIRPGRLRLMRWAAAAAAAGYGGRNRADTPPEWLRQGQEGRCYGTKHEREQTGPPPAIHTPRVRFIYIAPKNIRGIFGC